MTRQRLPDRRASTVFCFECNSLRYTASASWFDDGRLGEVFVSNHRADSHADSCARDAAILASIALQFGAPLDVLRRALLRDSQGRPSTPIGCALDQLANGESMFVTRRLPRVFVIKLQTAPGTDSIRALRALLKILLRRFGLRCLSAREEQPDLFGGTS